jgi:hypothetical protein
VLAHRAIAVLLRPLRYAVSNYVAYPFSMLVGQQYMENELALAQHWQPMVLVGAVATKNASVTQSDTSRDRTSVKV